MRKIIGILVVLGLVLGMVASAAPAVAQGPGDWTIVRASVASSSCEFERGTYTITFTPGVELIAGVHTVTVKFPAGTAYPEVWRRALDGLSGHISINATYFVYGEEVTRVGDEVTFVLPVTLIPGALVTVRFHPYTHLGTSTGIVNPAAGLYRLHVKTSRAPNSTYVMSGWDNGTESYRSGLAYRILKTYGVYKWAVDFTPTYPEIAWDYVPPFKACGQNASEAIPGYEFFTYEEPGIGWVTNFTLSFGTQFFSSRYGCNGCTYQKIVRLVSAPTGAEASLFLEGVNWTTFKMFPEADRTLMWGGHDVYGGTETKYWEAGLHFDKVGTYEMCFDAVYVGPEACNECQSETRCITFEVKQWKDVVFVELEQKWNLISLPIIPFDTSIDAILAPFEQGWFALRSIWNYDRCDDEWFVYGNGQESLTDIEGGEAYWVRMMTNREYLDFWKPILGHLDAASPGLLQAMWERDEAFPYAPVPGLTLGDLGLNAYYGPTWRLWVFGTVRPMAPSAPASFPVCEGWNMVGFLSVTPEYDDDYLWNFWDVFFTFPDYGTIYGWDPAVQNWTTIGPADPVNQLEPGDGYWIPFDRDGYIYP